MIPQQMFFFRAQTRKNWGKRVSATVFPPPVGKGGKLEGEGGGGEEEDD